MDEKTVKLSKGAAIAGMETATLWTAIHREHISLEDFKGELGSGGRGGAHMLSLETVERLAIANALRGAGLTMSTAWKAASKFFVSGAKSAAWAGEMAVIARPAGDLFADGETVLVVYADGNARVVNAPSLGAVPLDWRGKQRFPAIVLPLDELIVSVRLKFTAEAK